ncbi:hypothetical protein ACROYT_G016390 [Oculina patagonica]
MTASSYYSSSYLPAYGRLNFKKADGWCTKTPSKNDEWLQVDLGQLFEVCAVASQGDSGYDASDEWATAFKLLYSQDGKYWITYENSGKEMEFHRYGKSNVVDHHMLKPIYARYVRFNPTKRHKWNCLRVEVYGKRISTCFSNAVGVASSSTIPDKQMTASTYYSSQYKPANGRLNRGVAWCARTPSRNDEWLQVDLGQLFQVCGVSTQGERHYNEWVMAFKLSYSQNGKYWTIYKDENGNEMEFHRNGEKNNVDKHKLKPVSARYIRFNPTKRNKWNCLRVEVYGAVLTDCGVNLNKRILGGKHASPGEWRWHVQVGGCSGSLLTPQWAITAAHCVKGSNVAAIKLTLGQHTRSKKSGKEQERSISKYIMHPQYKFPKYDFALMKLANPATINDHVGTICLPESTTKLPAGTVLWETGWGKTTHYGWSSDVLKELEVVIVPRDSYWGSLHNTEFITTATEGHGTCSGDSGGPVVIERNGRWYLEAVHSWGRRPCGRPGYYDGQADVRAVLQWIKDTMKKN